MKGLCMIEDLCRKVLFLWVDTDVQIGQQISLFYHVTNGLDITG